MEGLVLVLLVLVGLPWLAVLMYRAGRDAPNHHENVDDPGGFFQEVVGEAAYQPALRDAALRVGSAPAIVLAVVVPESGNPHDENAVAVTVHDRIVGYLSREDAKRYRQRFGMAPTDCCGRIVGGNAGEHYGIWLDLKIRR